MTTPDLPRSCDAVVIGSGPNGLVAANLLADAGWDVTLLEAEAEPGGAVRSATPFGPDVVTDLFSAFYPLAATSPVIGRLGLEDHGLHWLRAPAVLAHPLADGRAAVLHHELAATVEGLEALHPGDGLAYARLHRLWTEVRDPLLAALFTPLPPVRPALRLAAVLRAAGLLRFVRMALLPVRRLAEEEFGGATPAAMLFAGNALHADLGPEAAGSALFGWLLTMLGQDAGFPVPRGGAGALSQALAARLRAAGGRVVCGATVSRVEVRGGRAVGVRVADELVRARRAVLADVSAPHLYRDLVGLDALPARMAEDLRRFQWDFATVKVNWLLDGPVPWAARAAGQAGTVHLAPALDDLTGFAADLARARVPATPFVLVGQMTTADPSRSPAGTESLWAYTHLPRAVRGEDGVDRPLGPTEIEATVRGVTGQLERFAPGFGARVRDQMVQAPWDLQDRDANLSTGAINGGTAAIHQQLVFRPTPGLGRPETPISGLYLAGASAHPGGGVHGACGANAAQAALSRVSSPLARRLGRALAK